MAYIFGLGWGHLGKRADQAAKKAGAELVNYTGAECNCGYNCRPHTCRKSRRHWFSMPDYGMGNNYTRAAEVISAVRKKCSKRDRALLGVVEVLRSDEREEDK